MDACGIPTSLTKLHQREFSEDRAYVSDLLVWLFGVCTGFRAFEEIKHEDNQTVKYLDQRPPTTFGRFRLL